MQDIQVYKNLIKGIQEDDPEKLKFILGKKTKLQYLKGPAPWLNQDGWLSDYQTEIEDAERNNPESLKTARRREGTERLAAIAREEFDRTKH